MKVDQMIVVVGIATSGRPEILKLNIEALSNQTRLPDRVIICPSSEEDLPELAMENHPFAIDIVRASKGLPHQRNAILNASDDADLIIFFDDDFFAAPKFIAECEALFLADQGVAVATGWVVADGINGPGISAEEAKRQLAQVPVERSEITTTYGAYGCNMA